LASRALVEAEGDLTRMGAKASVVRQRLTPITARRVQTVRDGIVL
jgi:hypothetical protein